MNLKNKGSYQLRIVLISGFIAFMIIFFIYLINGLAPFGTKSLAVMDAKIQYLDFFSYLKDVLTGKNSIGYTFSKTLGGCVVADFSYYLASPFNILVLFFEYSKLHSFFDLIVALKLSLAAMTFSFFAVNRFDERDDISSIIYILTAIGYALCQYNIAQSSNIMWLDGVYILPLILLQVSNIVRGKRAWPLPFIACMAVVFNWYTAGIDFIFSGFWFLFEFLLNAADKKSDIKQFLNDGIKCSIKYILGMLLGVLMSAALFHPTIWALRKSSKGTLNIRKLFDISFVGELPTVLQKYSYGAKSELGSVALFCGSLVIALALLTLFCKEINIKKRLLYFGLFAGSILSFYWNPLYSLFSLLKDVGSYWYRYSYIGIFSVLFLAIIGGGASRKNKEQGLLLIRIAIIFSSLQIMLHYLKPVNRLMYVYLTAACIVFAAALFVLVSFTNIKNKHLRAVVFAMFLIIGILDLSINAKILFNSYSINDDKEYRTYVNGQEELIDYIKSNDSSIYRISQTETRYMKDNGLTANYNEALAYNYASISGYTSSASTIQSEFFDRLGYRMNSINMCITNSSILGADSLLGVKYVLSPYAISGLKKLKEENETGKAVYENPYAFPFAFTYSENACDVDSAENPFEYQNELYKGLFGISEDLYIPLKYKLDIGENGLSAKIKLEIPSESNVVLYGNIPWESQAESKLYINGEFVTNYACWLSPSVFYIPHDEGDSSAEIELTSDKDNFDWNKAELYALRLDVLKKCADIANSNKAEITSFENGSVLIKANKTEDSLFISIPVDEGWDITVNGKAADIELLGDCLYSIKLTDDVNDIKMEYHVGYLKEGIALSLISVLGYGLYLVIKKRKRAA